MTAYETWQLPTRRLGRAVRVYERLESTSDVAGALARDRANDGVIVLAREQTAGRGQYGRRWECPPGSGVLLSAVIFPPPPLRRPALLTAWAAVSVCETVRGLTGMQAQIKWPNDVLVLGRKVCGILIEQSLAANGQPHGTVVGVGVNVNQTAETFAAAGLPDAASLAVFTGQPHAWGETARRLIAALDEEYDRLCGGDRATLEASWQRHVGLLGEDVVAECPDGSHRGRLVEMGWDGLVLRGEDGALRRLVPEAVRHLRPA
ncbi:MAG TPA: biotin--[acetyl-CoA-carboxylase] ligase [Gemmataceae bacterium]|nr:biotin--[acetyl-CoA-carboxylase] ligase [Gemmataceae bacterium]